MGHPKNHDNASMPFPCFRCSCDCSSASCSVPRGLPVYLIITNAPCPFRRRDHLAPSPATYVYRGLASKTKTLSLRGFINAATLGVGFGCTNDEVACQASRVPRAKRALPELIIWRRTRHVRTPEKEKIASHTHLQTGKISSRWRQTIRVGSQSHSIG